MKPKERKEEGGGGRKRTFGEQPSIPPIPTRVHGPSQMRVTRISRCPDSICLRGCALHRAIRFPARYYDNTARGNKYLPSLCETLWFFYSHRFVTSPRKSNGRKKMCRNFHDIPRCENIPFHCAVEHLRPFKIIDIYITEQFTDRDTESFARAVKKSVYSFIRKLYAIPRKSNTKRFSSFFFFFFGAGDKS